MIPLIVDTLVAYSKFVTGGRVARSFVCSGMACVCVEIKGGCEEEAPVREESLFFLFHCSCFLSKVIL